MKRFTIASLIGVGISIAAFIGCGTAATNNQGVSFTLLGFFAELPDSGSTEQPPGELGQAVPLSLENPETQSGNLAGSVSTVAGLKNNISSQFLRVDRMKVSYYIEGAEQQPPDTVVAFGAVLGPGGQSSGGDTTTEGSSSSSKGVSSLPDFAEIGSLSFGRFPIVTPEIMAWLNLYRGSLPELPFTMLATVKASAVGSAGERYYSNEATYFIIFTPDIAIAPTEGSDFTDGSGTTGDTTSGDTTTTG